jgi:predicted MarR family transcription regulator
MSVSLKELRRRGYSDEDIHLAQMTQDAARRSGGPVRSLAQILAGRPARSPSGASVEDLTARQLRRQGSYGQAALIAKQAALSDTDLDRADQARFHANALASLGRVRTGKYDLLGAGNVSIGNQYIDAVQASLMESKATAPERDAALATLLLITRHLAWQDYTCTKMAADLAEMRGVQKTHMSATLKLLESVGAISRVKKGRTKIIAVTPEGAFRGKMDNHAETVARYSAEVVQLHPSNEAANPQQTDLEDSTRA